jgi:acyl carrier protein
MGKRFSAPSLCAVSNEAAGWVVRRGGFVIFPSPQGVPGAIQTPEAESPETRFSVLEERLMSNVEEKIKAIIVEKLKVEEADVTPDKEIVRDLGADSLDQVELIMELEEQFGVDEIPEEEAAKLKTVADVINYVTAKVGSAS